jgi:hypothetical protein
MRPVWTNRIKKITIHTAIMMGERGITNYRRSALDSLELEKVQKHTTDLIIEHRRALEIGEIKV